MSRFHKLIGSAGLTFALAACVASMPPVEVTRFHNADREPISRGSIAIGSVIDENSNRLLEQKTFEAAVMRELQRVGFTDTGNQAAASEYIARVSIDQARITAAGNRSPVSVGVGGSTGSYGSGVGLGIGINLGGRPKDKIATELSVRIARRSNSDVIWEGRSSVEAKEGSPAAQPGLAASKLAEALFRDFPGEAGTTIRVP
ncbi:DUF4136 domain-containing protein [Parasphingorhabdus halotolerans]|uniref:DUF4136 domain-containing protein n=1 Tax=Parasphingorhabdus halotolerans TaxID=2725558 RepID=A0A6H2DPB7_9SPHN|nr:hypothetical protein [Parasphingorhabdus halotolerans]QJB69601.1 hypothetical protein HF685_10190 [Parasphingorhabdus halotolerans]